MQENDLFIGNEGGNGRCPQTFLQLHLFFKCISYFCRINYDVLLRKKYITIQRKENNEK